MNVGQRFTNAQRDRLRTSAQNSGLWSYVEPENLEEITTPAPSPTPLSSAEPKNNEIFSKTEPEIKFTGLNEPEVEFIQEEHKSSRNEINYKDILEFSNKENINY